LKLNSLTLALCFFVLTFYIGGALVDLDWMVVSYRYSSWHREQEFWEFFPGFRLNWWHAYAFTVLRLASGFFLLGLLLGWKFKRI